MSTNYPGSPNRNPGAVSTSNARIGPDRIASAADGDPVNAAEVAQAFKVSLDYAAWQMNPRAPIPASPGALDAAYVLPTKTVRNARLLRRSFADHRGFTGLERNTHWQEDWGDFVFGRQSQRPVST